MYERYSWRRYRWQVLKMPYRKIDLTVSGLKSDSAAALTPHAVRCVLVWW